MGRGGNVWGGVRTRGVLMQEMELALEKDNVAVAKHIIKHDNTAG